MPPIRSPSGSAWAVPRHPRDTLYLAVARSRILASSSSPRGREPHMPVLSGGQSVNHRAARLSLAAALLLSTLPGLVSEPARVSASDLAPSALLVTAADLPSGFAPVDEPGVASLLPDNLARQAAA